MLESNQNHDDKKSDTNDQQPANLYDSQREQQYKGIRQILKQTIKNIIIIM